MQLFGSRRQKAGQSVDAGRLRRAAEAEASGMTCLKEGNLVRAEAEFRRCVDLNPGGALGHGYLGLTLYRLGRLTEAASELS